MTKELKIFTYKSIVISPQKYNDLYKKFKNLNTLLGWGHANGVIEDLVIRIQQNVIIDKFANESVVEDAIKKKELDINLTQVHKGVKTI